MILSDPKYKVDNFRLYLIEEKASLTIDGVDTAIKSANASTGNGTTEYYTLSGTRVSAPQKGIYITKQGNKIQKKIIK